MVKNLSKKKRSKFYKSSFLLSFYPQKHKTLHHNMYTYTIKSPEWILTLYVARVSTEEETFLRNFNKLLWLQHSTLTYTQKLSHSHLLFCKSILVRNEIDFILFNFYCWICVFFSSLLLLKNIYNLVMNRRWKGGKPLNYILFEKDILIQLVELLNESQFKSNIFCTFFDCFFQIIKYHDDDYNNDCFIIVKSVYIS